ncbi:MAG TPA: SRPBCC family protein [Puia sp.]|nr:SRPBCC family protein [Puia sp.]
MNTATTGSITKELIVETSQANAFKVFTEKMDSWWPRTHHIGKTPMTEQVLEPGPKGRWFSRHEDGSEVDIGYVLVWQPNELLVLAWQVNGKFEYAPEIVTEVEVQFIANGPQTTLVKFEHKNIDRLGEGGHVEGMDEGWGMILQLYKKQALLTTQI